MIETYYAGAYWLSRQESAAACAQRAETYFRLLAPLDPTWTHWFEKANTLQEALKLRIAPVAATFEGLFAQEEHRLLADGFTLGVWNGEPHPNATRTNFACGTSSRFVSNVCVLDPPVPAMSPVGERIVTAKTLSQALRAMALAWEPDWGVVMSHTHRDMIRAAGRLPPLLVGWVTYLSHRRGTLPPLPAPASIEAVENLGTLITLTPERFTADNPSHIQLAREVRELLEHAGLLAPAPDAGK